MVGTSLSNENSSCVGSEDRVGDDGNILGIELGEADNIPMVASVLLFSTDDVNFELLGATDGMSDGDVVVLVASGTVSLGVCVGSSDGNVPA